MLNLIILVQLLAVESFAQVGHLSSLDQVNWVANQTATLTRGIGSIVGFEALRVSADKATEQPLCAFVKTNSNHYALAFIVRGVRSPRPGNDLGIPLERLRVGQSYGNIVPLLFDTTVPVEVRETPISTGYKYCTDAANAVVACNDPSMRVEKKFEVVMDMIRITRKDVGADGSTLATVTVACGS